MANGRINRVVRKRKDRDLDKVLKALKQSAVAVGVHSDAPKDGETTMATIAASNEFGSTSTHEGASGTYQVVVPERSFLRATLRANLEVYRANMKTIVNSVLNGKYDMRTGMGRLGRKVEQDVKKAIVEMNDPPNAPSTIAKKKGVNNPLVDEGRLLASIRWDYAKEDQRGIR